MKRKRAPITIDGLSGLAAAGSTPYDWLIPHVNVAYAEVVHPEWNPLTQDAPPSSYTTVIRPTSWSETNPTKYLSTLGGESDQWEFQRAGTALSYDPWALEKGKQQFRTSLNPNSYDWIIIGEYYRSFERAYIFDSLAEIARQAGIPANYDWTPCLAAASRQHWEQSGEPFRYLETPALAPIVGAMSCALSEYPSLGPIIQALGPGSPAWEESVAAARARRDAHKKNLKAIKTGFWTAAIGMGVAAALAPTIAAAGATAETAAAAASAGTASVSGAELAALVEAGTVGAEGAFLEAAALTGSTVTYNTATGALISALTPSGTALAFDPALDAFAQFNVEPSALNLPEAASVPSPESALPKWVQDEIALVEKAAVKSAQSYAAGELQSALADDPQAASGGGYYDPGAQYGAGGEFDLEGSSTLQPGFISGMMKKAAPLTIGAGLGLLALFMLGNDERN